MTVPAVSLKLKYAIAAFVAVLLAMAAVTVLLVWQHDSDTRHLGAMAEDTARESLDVELRARASSTAAHAADSITNSIRTRDTVTVARRLLPFIEDPTVAAITVAGHENTTVAPTCIRSLPIGPFRPKSKRRKNPTTVGGSTRGRRNAPSIKAAPAPERFSRHAAAANPATSVTAVAVRLVASEIHRGDQSIARGIVAGSVLYS